MRLNFKTIIVGGVVFYAVQWVLGMISGIVIHGGVLEPLYKATAEYWRPELMQDPPDMAALMPPSDGTVWHDPDLPLVWEGRSGTVG